MTSARVDSDGRERLLDAGAQLMVERGIDNVSLREINTQAGHRNSGAVHYYFGGRDALIEAILERNLLPTDEQRNAMLDELEKRKRVTVRDLARVVIEPLAAHLHTQSGRWHVMLIDQLSDRPSSIDTATRAMSGSSSLARSQELGAKLLPTLPPGLRIERSVISTTLVLRALAERARGIEAGREPPLSHQACVENLLDIVTFVMTAPPSADTKRALAADA